MVTEKAGGYISRLEFNTGESLDVKQNDIVVFVGPNNAGKSQSLKDIYTLSSKKISTIVVSDIEITKSEESLLPLLQSLSSGNDQGSYTNYSVLGHDINYWKESSDSSFLKDSYYGEFRDLFVANLDTAARLKICTPPNSINRNASKQHPIHYAAFDRKYRKWLSDNFKKAFGIEVTPNTQYGATIPLCIGEPVKLNQQYDDEQQRLEAYAAILDTYKQVQNQGDGIKSFTGILLYLMLDYYRTYLIDEPESFLHPPQARIMGQIIGQTLTNDQQAFIVENFIKQTEGKYSEALFIHCGGKHRMAKISTSMRALNIDIRLIPDIDVLNDETIFENIVEAYGIDWTSLQSDYNIIVSNLHSPKEKINRNDAKTTINRVLDASENRELSNREIKDIRSAISTISKWDALKSSGISAIPAGDATVAFRKLEQILRKNGIYIVPVGELEGFVKEVGGHGPDWVNKVLEKYPDLSTEVYAQVKQFISEMNL